MVTESIERLVKKRFPYYKEFKYYHYLKVFKYRLMELKGSREKVLASQLEQSDPIILYSVGARFGFSSILTNYLRFKKLLLGIGFEPDRKEAQRLKDNNLFDIVLPYALGSQYEVRKLNITEVPSCSSLFLPNKAKLKEFCKEEDMSSFNVKEEIDIEVHKLDTVLQKENLPTPDILQIDTQGFEFEILLGSRNVLKYISVVELEVHMYPIYFEEKTFTDIHDFMTENGFVLLWLEKAGIFGINYVEANACYFNKLLINKSKKNKLLIDYCSIAYGVDLLKAGGSSAA